MPSGYKHGDTQKKAMVRGVISYLEAEGLPVNKAAIFRHFELTRSQGYNALNVAASRRNDPMWTETRGRPSKLTDEHLVRVEAILWEEWHDESTAEPRPNGHNESIGLNWEKLAAAAGIDISVNKRTLHRAIGTLYYRRCMACGHGLVHPRTRERRVEWARRLLEALPRPVDWRVVRFGGELHFGFGLDGKVRLHPKPGERSSCPQCDAEGGTEKWARDVKRVHAWGAIGYGFKSELVFYEPSTSPNCTGAISMADYRVKILEGTVRGWLQQGAASAAAAGMLAADGTALDPAFVPGMFILEEDMDTYAHGGLSKVNPAQQWKEVNGLRQHFNCGDSPDLSPLDAMWPQGKVWTRELEKGKEWEDETLMKAAQTAWEGIDQARVDMWVDFQPQRLRHVIENDGIMVSW